MHYPIIISPLIPLISSLNSYASHLPLHTIIYAKSILSSLILSVLSLSTSILLSFIILTFIILIHSFPTLRFDIIELCNHTDRIIFHIYSFKILNCLLSLYLQKYTLKQRAFTSKLATSWRF